MVLPCFWNFDVINRLFSKSLLIINFLRLEFSRGDSVRTFLSIKIYDELTMRSHAGGTLIQPILNSMYRFSVLSFAINLPEICNRKK